MNQNRDALWDDDAFRKWVEEGAADLGLTVSEVLIEAGVSRFYLKNLPKPHEGRSTNIVLNLERILGKSSARLFGHPEVPTSFEELSSALERWSRFRSSAADMVGMMEKKPLNP